MNRFLLGFAIGATASAVIVLATTPKSGAETRHGLIVVYEGVYQRITETGQQIADRIQYALDVGRAAAAAREQELWADFHRRRQAAKEQAVKEKVKPEWPDYY